jgi:hypothetical protein
MRNFGKPLIVLALTAFTASSAMAFDGPRNPPGPIGGPGVGHPGHVVVVKRVVVQHRYHHVHHHRHHLSRINPPGPVGGPGHGPGFHR